MGYIKMNTKRLKQDEEIFAGMLRGMEKELDNLRENARLLDNMWDGPGSEAFKRAFNDDIQAVNIVLGNLENIRAYGENAKNKYESCEKKVENLISAIHV